MKNDHLLKCLILCLLGVLTSGCTSVGENSYFPLNSGLEWQYRVTSRNLSGQQIHQLQVENKGQQRYAEETYYVRRTNTDTDYFFQEDAAGIFRAGKRRLSESAPQWDDPKRYVLKYPLSIATRWVNETRLYALQDPPGPPPAFPMTYSIEAMKDTVTVPAGTFRGCIRIKGEGVIRLPADPITGLSQAVMVTTFEWYAPGAGLVKLQRREQVDTEQTSAGEILIELVTLHS